MDIGAALPGRAGLWLEGILALVIALGIATAAHAVVIFVARRAARRTPTRSDDLMIVRLCGPLRWVFIAMALVAVQPSLPLNDTAAHTWRQVAALVLPALVGWLAIAFLGGLNDIVEAGTDISVADNLAARRRRTRAAILYRIALFIVLLITFCMMLMTIPAVRNIGVTLIASAGLAGIAVGAAAQPALKNLIAGVQMAFTEPIRIDDVVIMDGEWGRIEEIRLTYVVVRIWDDRRLIVPVAKFLESSFQNWTRQTSAILGTAFLYVDPTADVPRLRARLEEIVKDNARWDGRVVGLQVTDSQPGHIELRCLVSAADAGRAFDLRCDVREAMIRFIVEDMPEVLVRQRFQRAAMADGGREKGLTLLPAAAHSSSGG